MRRRVVAWWLGGVAVALAALGIARALAPGVLFPLAGAVYVAWLAFAQPERRRWVALAGAVLLFFLPLFFLYGDRSVVPWILLFGAAELWFAALIWRWIRDTYWKEDPYKVVLGRLEGILRPPVEIPGEDRFLHVHVLGPTGSGKSEGVLWPMLRQDLARPVGVTCLDPKGDIADRVYEEARRLGRPAYRLGPGGDIGWNPLAGPPEKAAESVVYALEGAIPSDHPFYRTLSETLLRMAVLAVKEVKGDEARLADVLAFLSNEDERRGVLLAVRDEAVRAFFRDQYANWTKKARDEYTIGLRNALSDLLGNPGVGQLLARADLDLGRLLAEGGVLAVSLPIAAYGGAAQLFGRFLLTSLAEAALARPAGGVPHFLYVDEFQMFATVRFQEFLAMGRQSRVGAVLAHQNLAQLPADLRSAVLANARTRVLLGGLPVEDLEALRETLGRKVVAAGEGASARLRLVPRFDPLVVRGLPRGRALVQVVARGRVQEPCIVQLTPPAR